MKKEGSQYLKFGKTHYQRNKSYYLSRNKVRRNRNRDFVHKIKVERGCIDCSNKDGRVLEFDHLPQYHKVVDISIACNNGWSLEHLQREIDKCEVRCANCHKIKEAERYERARTV